MNGADLVAKALQAHGVTFLSALCGNGIDPVLYAARQAGMRIIDTHNEQTAAYMAESYSRFTGRIGVCAVSSAIGFINALGGAVNARFDGAPLLLLAGASDHRLADRGCFQDFDQVGAAMPICKYARLVDRPDKIAFYIHEAIAAATSGRPGPVHLTIPMDVLGAEVTADADSCFSGSGAVQPVQAADPALVAQAADALAQAQRPLLIAGSGVFYAQGDEALAAFLTQTNIPAFVPIWDRGTVASALPQFMGVIGAVSGSTPLLDSADLIIMLGAQVDHRVGYLQPPAVDPAARIVRISADPGELHQGIEPHLAIAGDPRSVLQQLCAVLPKKARPAHTSWLHEAQERDREFRRRWSAPVAMSGSPITGRQLVEALRPFVQGDTVFAVDGGNIGQWMHMLLCDRYPRHWMTCGASGVVGLGLGAAMAGKLAYPDRPVLLLSGDGSLGFNIADLESAVRHKLPIVVVVADDQAWGIVVSGQQRRWPGNLVGCRLGPIQFDLVAQACGAIGVRVENAEELGPAIAQGLAAGCPTLIHVPLAHGAPTD